MSREKLKILLAEDDLNLGVLLVDYLTTEGFEVKLCKDGELALKEFQSHSLSGNPWHKSYRVQHSFCPE